MHQNNRGRLIN